MPDDSKRGEGDSDEPLRTPAPDEGRRGDGDAGGGGGGLAGRLRGLTGGGDRGNGKGEREDADEGVPAAGRDPGTVLITGCSSGIGRSTALTFLEDDWTVYATARDIEDLADLEDAGCETAGLDVRSEGQIEQVVERVIDEDGRIDALVNNAGYGLFGPVEEVSTENFERQLDVNLLGPHRIVRAALPHMRRQGRGVIVNVSSVLGRVALPGTGPYSASKFGLEALSDSLRAEVDDHGLEVVLIEPGPVETAFGERASEAVEDARERTGAYEWFDSAFEDYGLFGGNGPGAVPPREVADAIHHAATCPDPQPRYQVGAPASLGSLGRFVPDRYRDQLVGLARRLVA